MRIALLEFDPDVGGTATWARHVKAGLYRLNHRGELVAFSGRGVIPTQPHSKAGQWCQVRWERLLSKRDAAEAARKLDEYDGVVCVQPHSWKQDYSAKRSGGLPFYADVLQRLNTPFTLVFHNFYKKLPFLEPVLKAPSFCGDLWGVSPDEVPWALERHAPSIPIRHHQWNGRLPYQCTDWGDLDGKIHQGFGEVVLMTGRIEPPKGQRVLAQLQNLSRRVELWGKPVGFPTAPSEAAVIHAMRGFVEEGKNAFNTPSWDEGDFAYMGPYSNPLDVLPRGRVHVSMTEKDYSSGRLEYATLEALDYGLNCVVPFHQLHDGAEPAKIPLWTTDFESRRGADLDDIAQAIELAGENEPSVERNQVYLREEHDPRQWAHELVSSLKGARA